MARMMARLHILLRIACVVSALLCACAQCAQARPGPAPFVLVEQMDTSSTELQPVSSAGNAEVLIADSTDDSGSKEHVRSSDLPDVFVTRGESESDVDSEEDDEHELVCSEEGKCYEKRLLTANVDYKTDGPNNPITDPPH